MSFEHLQEDWVKLLGEEGLRLAMGSRQLDTSPNALDTYASAKGLIKPCHYLLSEVFENCGLLAQERTSFSLVLNAVMERTASAADAMGLLSSDAPILMALSPYDAFGAEVMRAEHGYLVLVSPVTFSICFLFAILAVTSAQATGLMVQGRAPRNDDGTPLIDSFEWAYVSHHALASMIQEYLKTGRVAEPLAKVKGARFDLLPWHYIFRVQRTYEQMLDFLVLHELGHICLGHMRTMESVRRAVPSTSISYEVASPMPRQEEAADDYALACLIGKGNSGELLELSALLSAGAVQNETLDKMWMGETCLGRYTSALQLLKFFDILDTNLTGMGSGIQFSNICEINGSHPSGQHRFIRGWGSGRELLELPATFEFNFGNILSWQNWIGLNAANRTIEEMRVLWDEINRDLED